MTVLSKKNENMPEEDEEVTFVTFTDEQGDTYEYYVEETFLSGDTKYAVLVAVPDETDDAPAEEDEAFLAKIVVNDQGEEEFLDLEDEEFDEARKAYDALFEEN